jgi:hypothetical protein
MPLSDHEQRKLEEIERELQGADPQLAESLRAPSGVAIRRRITAAALFVSGLTMMLAAIILAPTMIPVLLIVSVLGFLLMFAGGVYAITDPRVPRPRPED